MNNFEFNTRIKVWYYRKEHRLKFDTVSLTEYPILFKGFTIRMLRQFHYKSYSHLYIISKYVSRKNMIKNKTGIRLKCQRDGTWIYTGNNQYYACCPKCKSSISIRKNKVQVDLGRQAQSQPEIVEEKVI